MARLLRMPEVAANAVEAVLSGWPVPENTPYSADDAIAVQVGMLLGRGHVGLEPHRVGFADAQVGVGIHHVQRREPGAMDTGHSDGQGGGVLGRGRAVGAQEDVLEHEGLSKRCGRYAGFIVASGTARPD